MVSFTLSCKVERSQNSVRCLLLRLDLGQERRCGESSLSLLFELRGGMSKWGKSGITSVHNPRLIEIGELSG